MAPKKKSAKPSSASSPGAGESEATEVAASRTESDLKQKTSSTLKGKMSGTLKQKSSSTVKPKSSSTLKKKTSSTVGKYKSTSRTGMYKSTSNISMSSSESSSSSTAETLEDVIDFPTSSSKTTPTSKKGKKGKGKKDKKKKRKKELEEEPEVAFEDFEEEPPEDDFSASLSFMQRVLDEKIAALEATDEVVVEEEAVSHKKRKRRKKPAAEAEGPKKKLSKKEKARLAAELAEQARMNAEEEAARQAELERIRLAEERKAAIEKEKRETFEQQIRMELLETSLNFLNDLISYNKQLREARKKQDEWEFYVGCARLPNPSKCDQMNTFLHLWENVIEETTMEEAAKRTVDVLELLNDLENLIDTAEKQDCQLVENWKWVRLLFRQQQAKSLDVATYRLLRDIDKNLNRIDIPTADYKYQDDNIALCLWLRIQLPTPLPNPRRPPKPRIEMNFAEMKMEVQFPLSVDGEKMAIRALYVKYDHLSDLSDTYQKPSTPAQYDLDLYHAMKQEWREKLIYKYVNRVRPEAVQKEEGTEGVETVTEEPKKDEDEIGPEDEVPIVPYRKLEPTASEYVIGREDQMYLDIRAMLFKSVDKETINLRKYSIIGGVYSLNLIHQPPQPQDFVTMEMTLTPLYLPKELEYVDFYVDYTPMSADAITKMTPEEIEEAMKKHEEELDKLIQITITWPEHVIFLELPIVCYWDESSRVWTKREVHDLKHNEEKGQLTFRTGTCGTFALAAYRYANLPYQAWEIRPEANGSVSLQITAAILMVEFNVKDGHIALSQLQNSPNNALQEIVGTYFPLPKLIRMMQDAGVDVFPAFDAFCYVENACEKHWPMERHLYFNMAQLSVCFNFASSRWNIPAGRRGVVMQMRVFNVEKTKQKHHAMCQVTPLNALYVDCTEVSATFSDQPVDNMKFFPDLFCLVKGTSNMAVKNKIKHAPKELVYAVYELLIATRVVSFS